MNSTKNRYARTCPAPACRRQRRSRAFTLVELVVVVAVLGLLASMLATTVATTRPASAGLQCLNNQRQLLNAWKMYADENLGKLPPNRDGGNVGNTAEDAAWVGGWLDYSTSPDNTNVNKLVNHTRYPYAAYLGLYVKSPTVFKCPADMSGVVIGGQRLPRVRSFSMNNYLGDMSRTWITPSKYQLCQNAAQIKYPAMMFVFVDEREDSINDGRFATDPDTLDHIIDFPTASHANGGTFSFADGRAEIKRWMDPRIMPPLVPGALLYLNVYLGPTNMDVRWLAQRAAGVASYP